MKEKKLETPPQSSSPKRTDEQLRNSIRQKEKEGKSFDEEELRLIQDESEENQNELKRTYGRR